ncbi:MAG: ComEC/Rec2 family competence protein [Hydrogenoanaerobacterium sp.]
MARYRRRSRINWGFVVVSSALLAAVLLVTLADKFDFGGKVPTWDDIFTRTGLAEPAAAKPKEHSKNAYVHFIDVGQGDCILIEAPEGNILVDAGTPESVPKLISYLKKEKITKLDYVVATHPHADHIGGMPYIIKDFDVGSFIAPRIPDVLVPASQSYLKMLKELKNKGMKITAARAGESYDVGAASFTILGPVNPDSENMNNNSVVLRFCYGNVAFLLSGDCERGEEKNILASGAQLSADVLKLGHHGSSTSSCYEWLAAVAPKYAVVCCGAENSYGHPHIEVSERLEEFSTKTLRTDIAGSIVFETDGKALRLINDEKSDGR